MPEWEDPLGDLRDAKKKMKDRRVDSSNVTYEKIAKFNRLLHPHVMEAAESAGISPEYIVMHAVFLMPGGTMLPCYLTPPLTDEDEG